MEQIEHQNLKISSHITRFQYLRKITQFLVSVSVFYLLLSNSSGLSFLHSFHLSFSTVPVQLFSHTIDKNCIFLLCNGLLLFVVKFSGSFSSCSSSKHSHNSIDQSVKNYEDDDGQPLVVEKEDFTAQENAAAEEEGRENEEYVIRQEVRDRDEVQVEEKESEVMAEEEVKEFNVQEEEEEEEEYGYEDEEENGTLSTEELNKKFEEFIRKMKEEIRLEAQQQLVMVN